ncbi:SDR family oxidoreductase [Sphingomonas crusticola]|uniref:SDR family oxidoreductase n=1 Tax=Sphingomonas crusticola TaxID=1697973 RepID=UPI000E232892|nr:SDR family oxidoreductase [Sphingomonas crusticola]
MDLGIKGKKALVCASSQGLGFACAEALLAEGCGVTINGRDAAKLERAAGDLRERTGGDVAIIVADLMTDEGRGALVGACPDADILVTNNAGPPPGRIGDWDRDVWISALEASLLAPILIIRELLPHMRARKFGRIINITSAMVKAPHPIMGLSSAGRAGLTAVCKSISHEAAADNVTINNLLPERMDTPRQEFMAQRMIREQGITRDEAREQMAANISAKRLGRPAEFGAACAFLCSAQASFISGQNLQLDGGSYEGLI